MAYLVPWNGCEGGWLVVNHQGRPYTCGTKIECLGFVNYMLRLRQMRKGWKPYMFPLPSDKSMSTPGAAEDQPSTDPVP